MTMSAISTSAHEESKVWSNLNFIIRASLSRFTLAASAFGRKGLKCQPQGARSAMTSLNEWERDQIACP